MIINFLIVYILKSKYKAFYWLSVAFRVIYKKVITYFTTILERL